MVLSWPDFSIKGMHWSRTAMLKLEIGWISKAKTTVEEAEARTYKRQLSQGHEAMLSDQYPNSWYLVTILK